MCNSVVSHGIGGFACAASLSESCIWLGVSSHLTTRHSRMSFHCSHFPRFFFWTLSTVLYNYICPTRNLPISRLPVNGSIQQLTLKMPIAHVSIPVTNFKASLDFYLAALKPLGYFEFHSFEDTAGLTVKNAGPDFWIHQCAESKKEGGNVARAHIAFEGKSHAAVKAFYEAAL